MGHCHLLYLLVYLSTPISTTVSLQWTLELSCSSRLPWLFSALCMSIKILESVYQSPTPPQKYIKTAEILTGLTLNQQEELKTWQYWVFDSMNMVYPYLVFHLVLWFLSITLVVFSIEVLHIFFSIDLGFWCFAFTKNGGFFSNFIFNCFVVGYPTVQHKELYPISCDRKWWKITWEKENMHVYVWLGHYAVQQK